MEEEEKGRRVDWQRASSFDPPAANANAAFP